MRTEASFFYDSAAEWLAECGVDYGYRLNPLQGQSASSDAEIKVVDGELFYEGRPLRLPIRRQ